MGGAAHDHEESGVLHERRLLREPETAAEQGHQADERPQAHGTVDEHRGDGGSDLRDEFWTQRQRQWNNERQCK